MSLVALVLLVVGGIWCLIRALLIRRDQEKREAELEVEERNRRIEMSEMYHQQLAIENQLNKEKLERLRAINSNN